MNYELRMKNEELRWGKSPPRSKVLAHCAAVFSATPSAELKLVVLGLSMLGREIPLKKNSSVVYSFYTPRKP